MRSPNKKIWLFMLDLNWGRVNDRDNYVNRITELSDLFGKTDEVIFVVPNIDMTVLYDANRKANLKEVWKRVNEQYYNLFAHFKIKQFPWYFFKPYTFDFCVRHYYF